MLNILDIFRKMSKAIFLNSPHKLFYLSAKIDSHFATSSFITLELFENNFCNSHKCNHFNIQPAFNTPKKQRAFYVTLKKFAIFLLLKIHKLELSVLRLPEKMEFPCTLLQKMPIMLGHFLQLSQVELFRLSSF